MVQITPGKRHAKGTSTKGAGKKRDPAMGPVLFHYVKKTRTDCKTVREIFFGKRNGN